MYLSARKYISNWDNSSEAEKKAYRAILKEAGVAGGSSPVWAPYLFVEVSVAYWRKANAVHGWFVRNCQDGVDNCKAHSVSRDQLEDLCQECESALAHRNAPDGVDQAKVRLNTSSGFFFGNTDYDDEYWYNLGDTVAQVRGVLANKSLEGFEFSYLSSW